MRIDVETHRPAVGAMNLLLLEIDRQGCVGAALGIIEELLDVLGTRP